MLVIKTILVKKYLHFDDPTLITADWVAKVIKFTIHWLTKGALQ
jgi:hypothetical protein